jgi:hypothetical protein
MPFQEKVVYLLGAGFSAPLGIPVIRHFIQRSKDLYFSEPLLYPRFPEVFKLLDEMGKAERYYHCDLFNVEEVLSILEMQNQVGSASVRDLFADFIRGTVTGSTPAIDHKGADAFTFLTKKAAGLQPYCVFVAHLCRLRVPSVPIGPSTGETYARYAVISLNYDMVLESASTFLRTPFAAFRPSEPFSDGPPVLVKLHGTVAPGGRIIAPTWNKAEISEVREAWEVAYQALTEATQIRFIGYSLPTHDAYIPFLLKAAVLNASNLKNIDVLCIDDDQQNVKKRYDRFVRFYDYRFANRNVSAYLDHVRSSVTTVPGDMVNGAPTVSADFLKLEAAHNAFFIGSR